MPMVFTDPNGPIGAPGGDDTMVPPAISIRRAVDSGYSA